MTNIINNNNVTYLRDNVGNKTEVGQSNQSTPKQDDIATSGNDIISMTNDAKLLNQINEHISRIPDVNMQRVEAIKAKLPDFATKQGFDSVATKIIRYESTLYG